MSFTKIAGVSAVVALALMASASTSSATTLEVGGVKKTGAVTISATVSGSSLWTDTFGTVLNTCTISTMNITTVTPFTGTRVGGPVSGISFGSCVEDVNEPMVLTATGSLEIEVISGTTNGTVFLKNTKFTTPSPFGHLTCTASSTGTDIGKLTGVKTGEATLDINAVLNCGIVTAKWTATHHVTGVEGLGVVS